MSYKEYDEIPENYPYSPYFEGACKRPVYTLDEFLDKFVLVEGRYIVHIDHPLDKTSRHSLMFNFCHLTVEVPRKNGKGTIERPLVNVWLEHDRRKTVDHFAFDPAKPRFFTDANGESCINTWCPPEMLTIPVENAEKVVAPFIAHIRMMFGKHTEAFLDWLAHIVQRPGERCSYGWHFVWNDPYMDMNIVADVVTKLYGNGCWVSSPSFFADMYTDSKQYMSRAVLAVVPWTGSYGVWEREKRACFLIHEKTRKTKFKYEPEVNEVNVCRWLVFSIKPVKTGDKMMRYFQTVTYTGKPIDNATETALRKQFDSYRFAQALRVWLNNRDISHFNPNAKPSEA